MTQEHAWLATAQDAEWVWDGGAVSPVVAPEHAGEGSDRTSVAPLAPEEMDAAAEAPANVASPPGTGFAIDMAQLPLEGGEAAGFGTVRWRTLICADRTPSSGMVLGVAEFGPGGTLAPHRHGPAEVYFGLTGTGVVTIDGVAHVLRAGVAIYVPPDVEHGTVAGPEGLSFAYGFPTERFADVDHRFSGR